MWEEELALHLLETPVAESAVLRQRNVDWKNRSDPAGHAQAMMEQLYPFVAKVRGTLRDEAATPRFSKSPLRSPSSPPRRSRAK